MRPLAAIVLAPTLALALAGCVATDRTASVGARGPLGSVGASASVTTFSIPGPSAPVPGEAWGDDELLEDMVEEPRRGPRRF
jgi:hypothetical protein